MDNSDDTDKAAEMANRRTLFPLESTISIFYQSKQSEDPTEKETETATVIKERIQTELNAVEVQPVVAPSVNQIVSSPEITEQSKKQSEILS